MRALTALAIAAIASSTAAGCVVRVRHPVPVPAPHAGPMSHDEAVQRALEVCHSRGFGCRVKEAKRKKDGRIWRVKLRIARGGEHGKMEVELDAYSREVRELEEELERDRDDDDDD